MACHFLGIFLFPSSGLRTNFYPLRSARSRFPQSWTTWKKGAWRMNRHWQSVLRAMRGQQRKSARFHLQLEALENRLVPSTAPFQHVLILSVDGLHQADVADPALSQSLTNILSLETTGVTYTNASTTSPSDSFPGTLAILTGATSGTTGVFYDDS